VSGKTRRETGKDSILAISISTILVFAGFWAAFQFVEPAPPKLITISTGSHEGAYFKYAGQYKKLLANNGVELKILTSAGSSENIQRLLNNEADIAFVQGGVSEDNSAYKLLSLGSLYYEPIWLFHRQSMPLSRLTQLAERKIAIGPKGSGTRTVALRLLGKNGIDDKTTQLLPITGQESASALLNGEIDALFMVASPDSQVIQQLLHNPQIRLMSFQRAEAYSRLSSFLSPVQLPQGIVDLKRNIPAQNVTLLVPTANLTIKKDFHPALSILLLQAAKEIHHDATFFSAKGEFPNTRGLEFPLSDVAERYYKNGPPFLMRFLPFWAAIMIDRLVVMLIPLVALLFPLFKIMPPLYRWRVRSKIYRWYRELQVVDDSAHGQLLTTAQKQLLIKELSRIENEVNKVKTPLSYADQVYNLLLHIDLVRKKVNIIKQAN
jgi:TRAP transporter TAXI family solute receptor